MDPTPPNRWLRHSAAAMARKALATLVGLLVWTVLPVLVGWQPSVVMSGSMAPAIRTGDVVLTREVPTDELQPGHVLLVEDPSDPGVRVLHRYAQQDDDGGLVLRGDANQQVDSAPVDAEHVRGVGVLRVPWVGLPYVWATDGRPALVALTALGIVALVALAPIRDRPAARIDDGDDGDGEHEHDVPADPAPSPDQAELSPAGARHAVVALVVLLVTGGAAGTVTTPATAGFTDTVSLSAQFTAGTWGEGVGAPKVSDTTSPATRSPVR